MAMPSERLWTVEEYLALEAASTERHEYRDGQVFAMAGATPEHERIAANLLGELVPALKGSPCGAYGSNLRILVVRTGLYTYADASVVCGEPSFDDGSPRALKNPTVIFEVLSSSTEAYDRGEKFVHYQQLPSLREYVLVSQRGPEVSVFRRSSSSEIWTYHLCLGIERPLPLPALGVEIPMSEIYRDVTFPASDPPGARIQDTSTD
jgi:Uma2 family endonuclease